MSTKKRDVKAQAKKDAVVAKASQNLVKVNTSNAGGICVDHLVPKATTFEVFRDGNVALSCYLMWSDVKNNHNKFYILQVLVQGTKHFVWIRYGRVGYDGVPSLEAQPNLQTAISYYNKKHREKTSKGYTEVKMAIGNPQGGVVQCEIKKAEDKKTAKSDGLPKSKLDAGLQSLISLIFDMSLIEKSVVQIGYDPKRLPLGQLSKETVQEGYKALREIEKVLNGKAKGDLSALSNHFYTHIPHNFGMQKMSNFIINSHEKLKEKLELISNLSDIQVAHKIVNKERNKKLKVNPMDENYEKLKCRIQTLSEKDEERKMLDTYLQNTRDGRSLKLLEAFKLEREGEDKIFNPQKLGNKKLLWHGSRFSNYGGILSQGLRIAPPEAPKTGYLFGKGVYFADLAGKSAPYCCANLSNNIGIFLVCEVALGKTRDLYMPDFDADQLPKGTNSTQCVGRLMPDPKQSKIIPVNVEVPLGKVINNDDKNVRRTHNEFIVYDTKQIKMKYLCMVKFA